MRVREEGQDGGWVMSDMFIFFNSNIRSKRKKNGGKGEIFFVLGEKFNFGKHFFWGGGNIYHCFELNTTLRGIII